MSAADVSTDAIAAAAAELLGESVAEVKHLGGEWNRTFAVQTSSGRRVTAKIAPDDDAERALLDWQHRLMDRCFGRPGLPTPEVLRGGDGADSVAVGGWRLSCYSWLTGRTVNETPTVPTAVLTEWGRVAGLLVVALDGLEPPPEVRQSHEWDLWQAPEAILAQLDSIDDAARRQCVMTVLGWFDDHVAPARTDLPRAVVHHDLNDHNVLVHDEHVSGVIDFTDALSTTRISELAIAGGYGMLRQEDPVAALRAVAGGFGQIVTLRDDELNVLYPLAALRLALNAVTWTSRSTAIHGDYGHQRSQYTWATLARLVEIAPSSVAAALRTPDPGTGPVLMANGFDRGRLDELPAELRTKIQRRERVLSPGYRLFYETPLAVVRGAGTYLYDADGNEYLDAYNNVPCVGHAHPRITDAVHRQMQLVNTNTRYVQDLVTDYAEDLIGTFPAELDNVTFTSTGSEANDLALRVARHYTGGQGVIVTRNAYHGLTAAVAECSPSLGVHSPLGPHVRTVNPPDRRLAPGDLAGYFREQVRAAIDDLHRHGYGLSAFLADSIFSSDGVFADPPGFLAPVVDEVHAAGGLYIADEVQPGFGRTGAGWWGFERHGIRPDMVTVGKPMGNGLPIAAAVFAPHVIAEFGRDVRYFNTFGGNSVSIAAAQEVLRVIRDEQLIDNAREVGATLLAGLRDLTAGDPRVTDVRGVGLFIGVEISTPGDGRPDPGAAAAIVNVLRGRRVLISASGYHGNVLKVRPPMAFRAADAERLLTEFGGVLRADGA